MLKRHNLDRFKKSLLRLGTARSVSKIVILSFSIGISETKSIDQNKNWNKGFVTIPV